MDDFLFEWSLYEYLQIRKYMKASDKSTFILANYDKILNFNDPKFISLNKANISLLPPSSSFLFLEKDINDYLVEKEDILSFKNEVFPCPLFPVIIIIFPFFFNFNVIFSSQKSA